MDTQAIPLLDLSMQNGPLRTELLEALTRVIDSQRFILGGEGEAFERELAAYCGTAEAIGLTSGTDALVVSLMALGVGLGDEVITSAYSFFATAGSIARLGATPVFVDIDPVTFNIDPSQVEERITPRTKAIVPVHLYGRCAAMQPILEIAARRGLDVIEDAAQAIGAEYEGRRAGSMGTVGCFSFFPSKNLGALGDAGAVTTNDPQLAERIRCLRVHGAKPKYFHKVLGGNFRLDELQAAALRVKLPHLDEWTAARQRNAARYDRLFAETGLVPDRVVTPAPGADRHVQNQYVCRVADRAALVAHLHAQQIGCEIYYPVPLHLAECFADLGYRPGDLPEAEEAANTTLALPIYAELTESQQVRVVETIGEFYRAAGNRARQRAA